MKVLLISTLAHNPGDEFIRLGAGHVLRVVFPEAEFRTIHKHDPRTLFASFEQKKVTPHRLVSPLLYRLYAASGGRKQENLLESADLVVFAGTPFIWRSPIRLFRSTCANAEWIAPTWGRLFQEVTTPVMNLAAGASATDQADLAAITHDKKVRAFLERALQRATLTTVRDTKAQAILAQLGMQVDVVPCSSILAAKGAHLQPQPEEYVAINLMRSAAHSWRGQRGDPRKWRRMIEAVVPEIEKRYPVLFVSHSEQEDATVAEWFPQHRRMFSKDPIALLKAYSKAVYGVCNRVHAAAGVATFGRPAMVIGGDSRIQLVAEFGLPVYDHRDLTVESCVAAVHDLEDQYDAYVSRLRTRSEQAEQTYLGAIRKAWQRGAKTPAMAHAGQ